MTDFDKLAELLFPEIDKTPEYYENLYPQRNLSEGARVTRLAPSPTGFLHLGNLFTAMVSYRTAKCSNGIFYVRVEDTDQKRRVEGAVEVMLEGLKTYGVIPDEGVMPDGSQKGSYGPYIQSQRKEIYQAYAKQLVKEGLAYPCFCSAEEIEAIRESQENEDIKGYWGKYAKCRSLSYDEIKSKIDSGAPYTLRLRSNGDINKKIVFDDMIKGKIEMSENVIDVVLLKADGIPTYHFAHVIDDHLMRTTHVTRGDEWIASVPLHIQLFKALGFKPVKYAHIAPIMKEDNGGKRKLSKRKDPEAAVTFYKQEGYPSQSVNEYMMTVMNSNFEDWRRANKTAPLSDFPFNFKKMSASGALFDLAKLNDISKNVISLMSANEVFDSVYAWAEEFSPSLKALFDNDKQYAISILNIDRDVPKPRKDIAKWSEVSDYFSYMFDETFEPCFDLPDVISKELASDTLEEYIKIVDTTDDKELWFSKIKDMCQKLGCTPNVKDYKKNPELYRGHVGTLSTIIRIALTGRTNTPDLHCITSLLGEKAVNERLKNAIEFYKKP